MCYFQETYMIQAVDHHELSLIPQGQQYEGLRLLSQLGLWHEDKREAECNQPVIGM